MENPEREAMETAAEAAAEVESGELEAPDGTSESEAPAPPPGGKSVFREILETVLLALILALIIRAFLFESFLVQGNSMEPTLADGERLLVNKLVYQFDAPTLGDIVVFRYPRDPQRDFIKRVVGVPGDRVQLSGGYLYVNDQRYDEDYVVFRETPDFGPVDVPDGEIFVLGDNRENSRDSRNFGHVPVDFVKGRAMVVFWPVGDVRLFYFPPPGL